MKHEAIFSQYETHQQQVKEIQEEFLWLMKT